MKNLGLAISSLLLAFGCSKAPTESAPVEQPAAKAEAPAAVDTPKKVVAAEAPKKAAADPHAAFANVAVDEMEGLLAKKKAVPVDANGAETRAKYGTLPGAVKLSSYKSFEASELPADKGTELVFYCGSQACTAAPKAANRAKEAGYSSVKVMRDGIRGWVKAGKDVEKS